MKKLFYAILLLSAIFISACKKEKKPVIVGSFAMLQDSVYLYAKEDYLWYDALPDIATFNPNGTTVGTTDVATLQNEVNKLSQYKINPATGLPYEYYAPNPGEAKYSFIDDGTVSAELNGIKGDFGFAPFYNTTTDLRIKYVYPNSPAALAGVKRGYQIISINGNTNLTYDGTTTSTNLNFVINAYAYSSNIVMILQKPDGTSFTVTLATASYTVNPVLKDSVYTTTNGKKIGYIVFNSFTADANADPQLDPVFASFASQGVTDVVVDLRYNGGGYVSTAQHLDNLLVPASKTGTLMYTTYYNAQLQKDNYPLLAAMFNITKGEFLPQNNVVNFSKTGSLNINRVFFIVTGATASAAELTINNLRPEMDVQLIGNTSYGKPVGFFSIDVGKYQLYIPEFYVENSANQGDYYSGFTPGSTATPGVIDNDDVTKDFGDPTEKLLAHALNYVTTGNYAVRIPNVNGLINNTLSIKEQNIFAQKALKSEFSGMIADKKLQRKK